MLEEPSIEDPNILIISIKCYHAIQLFKTDDAATTADILKQIEDSILYRLGYTLFHNER